MRLETTLIETAGDGAHGEGEPRDVLSQKLGSTGVESGSSSSDPDHSTHPMDNKAPQELADHEEEYGQIEEEEDENQDEVDPQSRQAEGRRQVKWVRWAPKNRLRGFSGTYRKMEVMINQAAKKIPIAPLSCPG